VVKISEDSVVLIDLGPADRRARYRVHVFGRRRAVPWNRGLVL
jgi:hypothetical protein